MEAAPMADDQSTPQPQPQAAGSQGSAPPPSALPPELQTAGASTEFRTWGMIAHLAALAGIPFPTFGNIVGPLVVYLMKKDESRFVAFHARQAMFFQIAVSLAGWVLVAIGVPLLPICIWVIPMGLSGAVYAGAMVYSALGAFQIYSGKDFEYFYVGEKVRNWGK